MEDNPYSRAIPKAYLKEAGLDTYSSHVVQVRGSCDRLYRDGGPILQIEESAFCRLLHNGIVVNVIVPRSESPALFDAIIHISESLKAASRFQRFTEAFKAYESLETSPDLNLAAIRHAISHPETALSRPKTVAALRLLFGSSRIELVRPAHRRVFFRELGRLFVKLDELIGEGTLSNRYRWHLVPHGYHPAAASYSGWFPRSSG